MAQFDVYASPDPVIADDLPYLVDLQADFLHHLPTRVFVPLARPGIMPATSHLNPLVDIGGASLVLLTNQLIALPATIVGPPVASLAEQRYDIIAALDFLFTGI